MNDCNAMHNEIKVNLAKAIETSQESQLKISEIQKELSTLLSNSTLTLHEAGKINSMVERASEVASASTSILKHASLHADAMSIEETDEDRMIWARFCMSWMLEYGDYIKVFNMLACVIEETLLSILEKGQKQSA